MEWLKHFVIDQYADAISVNGWTQGASYFKQTNGQLITECNYLDNQKHRVQFRWGINNNKLVGMDTYVNGSLEGIHRTWYINGRIANDHIYVEDLRHGIQQRWYINGRLKYKHNYVDGQKHGIQLGWYNTGHRKYKYNYINGNKRGKQIKWCF
mgnify:CR=1 FL=1